MRKEDRNGVEWTILEGNEYAVLRENSHAELWENSHAVLRENSHAVLRENSHAELWENSHAVLWENSHAVLWENSHAVLRENSHAVLRGNSHAELRENSHAELWENSHAVLWENSHAVLRENSHAELWENSHAVLRENSHAELWENSHAVLWENSHAVLWGNSHAELWDFSVVHQLSKTSKIKKGLKSKIIIPNYPKNIKEWAKIKGLKINKNIINLYKVLRLNGTDFYSGKIDYLKESIAPDWDKKYKGECGCGLHLADSPEGAKHFLENRDNYLLIEVSANIKDCIAFGGQPQFPMKLRARACRFVRIIEKVENGKLIEVK